MEEPPKFIQDRWETICCHFNPKNKKWKCLSAADVSFPGKERYEILEVEGIKLASEKLRDERIKEFELIAFKPEAGQNSWISLGENGKSRITNRLCDSLHSLNATGKTEAETKKLVKLE